MSRGGFEAWTKSIREQVVPAIVAVLVYAPLAYLWIVGSPVSDAHMSLAGVIAGYYFSRATANGSAREAAAAAVGMTLAQLRATEGHDASTSPD